MNQEEQEIEEFINATMAKMFVMGQMQFGDAVRGCWFHHAAPCPACGRDVDPVNLGDGKQGVSLNTYIFRERGMLIGYLLCNRCARRIHNAAERNPGKQIAIHDKIEATLKQAYLNHMNSMDA